MAVEPLGSPWIGPGLLAGNPSGWNASPRFIKGSKRRAPLGQHTALVGIQPVEMLPRHFNRELHNFQIAEQDSGRIASYAVFGPH